MSNITTKQDYVRVEYDEYCEYTLPGLHVVVCDDMVFSTNSIAGGGILPGILMACEATIDEYGDIVICHHDITQRIMRTRKVYFNGIPYVQLTVEEYNRVLSAVNRQMRMC